MTTVCVTFRADDIVGPCSSLLLQRLNKRRFVAFLCSEPSGEEDDKLSSHHTLLMLSSVTPTFVPLIVLMEFPPNLSPDQ